MSDTPCLNPKLGFNFATHANSERSSTSVKPRFPRLAWLKKKREAEVRLNEDHTITWIGGFHEKQ